MGAEHAAVSTARTFDSSISRLIALLVVAAVALFGVPAIAAGAESAGPSITTDQADYAPGSTVTLSGAGWPVGESVHVTVNDDEGQSWKFADDTVADGNGEFVEQVTLPDWFVATYTARATGSSGAVAMTTFTDSNIQVGAVDGSTKLAVDVLWQTYRKDASCTGTTQNSGSVTTVTNGNGFTGTSGVGSNTAMSLLAATNVVIGGHLYVFHDWSVPFSGTTNPLCVPGNADNGKINELASYTDAGPTSKLDQTISYASLSDKTFGDADFTVTATASSGLPVSFSANGSCTVSGDTMHLTGVGDCTITATQDGDATYLAATPVPRSFTVNPGGTTVTVTCPPSVTYSGSAQTPCTAVATGAGLNQSLPVTYSNNTDAGTATASAGFAGDATHNAAPGSTTFAITQVSSSVLITCPASVTYTGSAQTPCTAVATGVGGLNQSLTPHYSANTDAGTANVSATFAGDANHTGSSDSTTFTITKASSTTTLSCPTPVAYTGSAQQPCTASVTGAGGLHQSVTPSYTANTAVGTAHASACYEGDANHDASSDSATFDIVKAASVVSINCPTSVTYNGT